MKKILISVGLTFFAFAASAQRLKTVKLDSLVSVSLPADFHKTDTLGQQTYTASAQYGYIIVARSPNPPGNQTLKKEMDLDKVFKEYIRKVQGSLPNGNIINDHDTIINNVELRDFILRTDTGSGVQLRKFRILYTKPVTYTFQYLYDVIRKEVAKKERDDFFKSIIISPGLSGADQYALYGKPARINTLAIVCIAAGVIIIVLVILLLRKRRRNDILIDDVLEE
jgi:hypothetical protein